MLYLVMRELFLNKMRQKL